MWLWVRLFFAIFPFDVERLRVVKEVRVVLVRVVTVVKETLVTVVMVTVVILVVVTVAVGRVVIVTSFSENNLTPQQPMRCSQGRVLRFSQCFTESQGTRDLVKRCHYLRVFVLICVCPSFVWEFHLSMRMRMRLENMAEHCQTRNTH